jgi:hypothetical protein
MQNLIVSSKWWTWRAIFFLANADVDIFASLADMVGMDSPGSEDTSINTAYNQTLCVSIQIMATSWYPIWRLGMFSAPNEYNYLCMAFFSQRTWQDYWRKVMTWIFVFKFPSHASCWQQHHSYRSIIHVELLVATQHDNFSERLAPSIRQCKAGMTKSS